MPSSTRSFACSCVVNLLLIMLGLTPGAWAWAADPTTDLVLLIDNSSSNRQTDPNRLRGIAAELILDALTLPGTKIRVGVIFFASQVSGDETLGAEADARKKLRTQLDEDGATNMEGGLTQALKLLQSSTATHKLIVMMTDGAPDPRGQGDEGQMATIQTRLTPLAVQEGIKIFALGLSQAVNQSFLEAITTPTGGRMVTVNNAQEMLKVAKQLVSDFNNIHRLKDIALPSSTLELPFDLPTGIERQRVTLVLEQPRAFTRHQIAFQVQGCPDPDRETLYTTTQKGVETVVAWSAFFSTTGQHQACTLGIQVNKPGAHGHGGLAVLIEGRTDLHSELTCRPADERLRYGAEVVCDLTLRNNAGPLDPQPLHHSGRLITSGPEGSGSKAVTVTGATVRFQVPEVTGYQTLRVESSVDPAIPAVVAEYRYQAIPPQPAQWRAQPATLDLGWIGPDQPETRSAIDIWTEFPNGDPRAIPFTVHVLSPLQEVISLAIEGRPIQTRGTHTLTLSRGRRLTLDVQVSLNSPHGLLHLEEGRQTGIVVLQSAAAEAPLEIPFTVEIHKPQLVLTGRQDRSLYWKPQRPVTLSVVNVATDGLVDGRFTVEPREQLVSDRKGIALGRLTLLPDDAPQNDGSYPLTRAGYTLRARYTPTVDTPQMAHGAHAVTFRVKSTTGAETPVVLQLWTLPVWWEGGFGLGPVSLHLQHLLLWGLVGGGLVGILLVAGRRIRTLMRWRRFRPGQLLEARDGAWSIGPEEGGLVLPNDPQGRLTDTVLGRLRFENGRLTLLPWHAAAGSLTVNERPLTGPTAIRPGDMLAVRADDAEDALWEQEYLGAEDGGGLFEVLRNPLGLRMGRVLGALLIGVIVIGALRQVLLSDWVAEKIGQSAPIEALYVLMASIGY